MRSSFYGKAIALTLTFELNAQDHRRSRFIRPHLVTTPAMFNAVHPSEIGMSIPITELLRDATRALHTEVERAGVMQRLLRGQLPRAGYVQLLRNLHAIYAALERGLSQRASDPGLAALHCEPLFRSDALREDLNFLHGADWAETIPLTFAATHYAAHLHSLATRSPLMLGAHAYVRYLGDLSGGQMLHRIVVKSLGLPSDQGVKFYEFGSAENVKKLAQTFRAGLNLMTTDAATAQGLVDEACAAFARHKALFEALAVPEPAAIALERP